MQVPTSLVSIGKLSANSHTLADHIRQVAAALGITPALTIDDREFYQAEDAKRIACHVAQQTASVTHC